MLKPARSFYAEQYSLQQQQQRGLASSSGLDYSTLSTPPGSPLHDQIMESAAMRQTGVSLKTLIDTGRGELLGGDIVFRESDLTTREQMLIQVASFLHRELPIRLAHRLVAKILNMKVHACSCCIAAVWWLLRHAADECHEFLALCAQGERSRVSA
jgi:hypothetical protein